MTLLSCRNIKKSFGDKEILLDLNVDIDQGEKLGIVGRNGAGKTTFLNIIQGRLKRDSGMVRFYKDRVKIAYLLQSATYEIINYDGSFSVEQKSDEICQIEDESLLRTASITGLQKVGSWSEEQLANLSGGERTKLALSNIWISKPDILILDEPTNHMDTKGIEWLIEELGKYKGTCIIVSHDRYFLDESVKRIVEIEDGKVNDYRGNYSFYREEKARRYELQLNQYMLQEERKRKLEEQIDNLQRWSHIAHRDSRGKAIEMGMKFGVKEYFRKKAKKRDIQVKSRIKRLKKIEIESMEKPKEEMGVYFGFEEVKKGGKRLLEARDISKEYEGKVVFYPSSFYIGRGEKIGIIGPNGCGKTTLLRGIMGQETFDGGELWISESAKIVYLSQENKEEDGDVTLGGLLDTLYPERKDRIRAINLLVSMGIDEKSVGTPFNELSYGERVRVRIANMILKDNDMLVLDEPTNHLDLFSREKLEEALLDYQGTVLFVSHDRYAVMRVCEKLLVFEDKRIRRFEGNLTEYNDRVADMKMDVKKGRGKKDNSNRGKQTGKSVNADKTQKMLLELKIARALGRLSMLKQEDEEYQELDREYKRLIEERNMNQQV